MHRSATSSPMRGWQPRSARKTANRRLATYAKPKRLALACLPKRPLVGGMLLFLLIWSSFISATLNLGNEPHPPPCASQCSRLNWFKVMFSICECHIYHTTLSFWTCPRSPDARNPVGKPFSPIWPSSSAPDQSTSDPGAQHQIAAARRSIVHNSYYVRLQIKSTFFHPELTVMQCTFFVSADQILQSSSSTTRVFHSKKGGPPTHGGNVHTVQIRRGPFFHKIVLRSNKMSLPFCSAKVDPSRTVYPNKKLISIHHISSENQFFGGPKRFPG